MSSTSTAIKLLSTAKTDPTRIRLPSNSSQISQKGVRKGSRPRTKQSTLARSLSPWQLPVPSTIDCNKLPAPPHWLNVQTNEMPCVQTASGKVEVPSYKHCFNNFLPPLTRSQAFQLPIRTYHLFPSNHSLLFCNSLVLFPH